MKPLINYLTNKSRGLFYVLLLLGLSSIGSLSHAQFGVPTTPTCFNGSAPCTNTNPLPCSTANPFCSDQNYNFPNEYGGSGNGAPCGPNYCCLGSTPNPVWYYMEIAQSGIIELTVSQTTSGGSPLDIDFTLWGHLPIWLLDVHKS
ncbi:MAG: hypothetical protein M9897_01430 [Brumimicrobium sp.]|nr:hypothetical protein [Brumimicrobium sp.]